MEAGGSIEGGVKHGGEGWKHEWNMEGVMETGIVDAWSEGWKHKE